MLENSQRVKTRNCKRLWRKSIKRVTDQMLDQKV
jgi:hypothetical protein